MIKFTHLDTPWYLSNPHVQTLWPFLFRKRQQIPIIGERLELPDGDFVDLIWTNHSTQGAIIIFLHGLEGSINSHYATALMQILANAGFRVVFMHFRGCSGVPNRRIRSYHSGETQDLEFLVETIQDREPDTPIGAIGISLGGNVLLKWLGETSRYNPLTACVAVSVPFQLEKAVARMEKGFSKIYQYYLVKNLVSNTRRKFENRPAPFDVTQLNKIKTLREFDDIVTAPIHGFKDAEHYYLCSNSRQFLHQITVPTLILHSKDDPFMTSDVIPNENELSSAITLELSNRGGHVGFVKKKSFNASTYTMDERICEFLSQNL